MCQLHPFSVFSGVDQVIYSQEKQFSLRQTLTNYNEPMAASATFFLLMIVSPLYTQNGHQCMANLTFPHSSFILPYEKATFYGFFHFVALHESPSCHTHGREQLGKLSPWTVLETLCRCWDGWSTRVSTGTNRRRPENEGRLSSQFALCYCNSLTSTPPQYLNIFKGRERLLWSHENRERRRWSGFIGLQDLKHHENPCSRLWGHKAPISAWGWERNCAMFTYVFVNIFFEV